MSKKISKYIFPIFLFAFLVFEWVNVFFIGGKMGVVSWWSIFFGSIVGLIILIAVIITILIKKIKRRKIHLSIMVTMILSLLISYPFCWFFGIGQIVYPAQIDSLKPAVSISLPLSITTTVGWGGDSLDTNRPHAIVPMERWAYDLLVQPYSINSNNLKAYGIYNAEVVAPCNGTIVQVYDQEDDILPDAENYKTMMGNYIYMKIDETGTYLVLAHLKKDSILVKNGQHVKEGTLLARVGNSGASSEPHLHIHHQRQSPATTSMFLSEGLPLYFHNINGPSMPKGGINKDVISPNIYYNQ